MDLGLRDRVFLVTGGSRGLGRASAAALVEDGARVLITGRTPERVNATAAELGPNALGMVADNAEPDAALRLVETALETFGRLDGALISVGGPPPGTMLDTTEDAWHAAFETLYMGSLRIALTVAGRLDSGGSMLFVLSTSVKSPIRGLATSNGLRPGLAMAAKNLADELGPRNIRVNSLLPGRVATERVAELDAATGDPQAAREASQRTIPLGRYGEPPEFGRVAAFLLSPAASYVTGCMLPVDGGMLRAL